MRQTAAACGVRPGGPPEEVIRALSRACGVSMLGLFPASTDDVLLDHVGRRLGLPPLLGGLSAIVQRERTILAHYLRIAWEAADPPTRRAFLRQALQSWDHSCLPHPTQGVEPPDEASDTVLQATLEVLVQSAAGCRALAVAAASYPMPYPASAAGRGSAWATALGARAHTGHAMLYTVLLILWRARARLLIDRRAQRIGLDRQLGQMESFLSVRRRNLQAAPIPWRRNPLSGASVAAGAAAASAISAAVTPPSEFHLLPLLIGLAGALWATRDLIHRSPSDSDERVMRLEAQIHTYRTRLGQVDRDIAVLESE
jgi:hypothetical protein